jgi:hypothetical protein
MYLHVLALRALIAAPVALAALLWLSLSMGTEAQEFMTCLEVPYRKPSFWHWPFSELR